MQFPVMAAEAHWVFITAAKHETRKQCSLRERGRVLYKTTHTTAEEEENHHIYLHGVVLWFSGDAEHCWKHSQTFFP